MPSPTNIIFPVEIINRELDFRLWLACLYSKKGTSIYIGQHDVVYALARGMRGGVYVGKNPFRTAFPCDMTRYETLKANDFSLVHLDEEGLCTGNDPKIWARYLSLRLDASCLKPEDYVATWGNIQKDYYRSHHQDPDKVRTTGHPRFDLYKRDYRKYFDHEVKAIRDRFGDFVLINTNLVYPNNGLGLADTFTNPNFAYDVNSSASRINHFTGWALQSHLLCNLVKLVNRLSLEFPRLNFVIRPHPGENWDYYRIIFRGIPNVHMVHEGSVAPWLFGCRALIHDACTTGVEAHFADCKIINYKSYRSSDTWLEDVWLPGIFGARCTSEEQVIEKLARLESDPELTEARFTDNAHGLIDNFRHPSFDRLVTLMEEAEGSYRGHSHTPSRMQIDLQEGFRRAKQGLKKVVRPLFPAKQAAYEFFTRNCFYGFNRVSINRKLAAIQSMLGKEVHCEFVSDSIMRIESA